MNAIRQTQLLNKRELENATPPSASWHADYRDTAWIYVGGLHLDLTEGDVCIIFSQYGNPTHLNLVRDKENGKSKGFGFLKYEDQRSCDLAVDNLGGAEVLGRLLRVDHTRYKKRDDEDEDTYRIERLEAAQEAEERALNGNGKRGSDTESEDEKGHRRKKRRHMLKEEEELEEMLAITQDGEEEDPMREYLIKEKKEEVQKAKRREEEKREKRKHRHHRRDPDWAEGNDGSDRERRHRHHHRDQDSDNREKRKDHDIDHRKAQRDDRAHVDRRRRDGYHKDRNHSEKDREREHRQRHRHDSRERRSSRDRNRDRDHSSRQHDDD